MQYDEKCRSLNIRARMNIEAIRIDLTNDGFKIIR